MERVNVSLRDFNSEEGMARGPARRLRPGGDSPRIGGFMKKNLHPEYQEVLVHCACGETWTTHSTKKELRLEICSKCHPFFTGKQKLMDSAGRVERFRKRYEKKAAGASA